MYKNTHSSEFPVAFLSLGPGDSDLLTIKAVRTLKEADCVMVPATRGADGEVRSRAAEIISEWCEAERIAPFCLPMQRERDAVNKVYDEMFERIAALYHEGKRVAVAVEGDISIYASIHYVMERLQQTDIPVVQLAGIPSFIAAAAEAGLSLVSQQQRLVVLPGDADASALQQLLSSNHVVVVMKLSQCQEEVKAFLRQQPQLTCHYFENIGTPEAYHTTSRDEILSRRMPYFSLCIIYPA